MNWITGPNRAFGIGETKSQNAVIKVYSAAELKNALTKIYQLPSGVGTIEIAGDIIITEPIKLRYFLQEDSKIREIIIQAISGARIINGNRAYGTTYNYNTIGNNNIPVFDFGILPDFVVPVCKYTFKDLVINTETSKPFGALIAANSAGSDSRKLNTLSLNNIKAYNLWNILATYDTTNFAGGFGRIQTKNIKIDDFKYLNVDNTIVNLSYNTERFITTDSIITNVGALDILSGNYFIINNTNVDFTGNVFNAISAQVVINGNSGIANTIISSYITASNYDGGFTYISTIIPQPGQEVPNTIIPTAQHKSALHLTTLNNAGTVPTSSRFLATADSTASLLPGFYAVPANSYYELDWKVIVNFKAASRAATTTSGLTTIPLVNTAELKVGMGVSGTNIPAGATIASISPGVSITLSIAASGSGSTTLAFVGQINTYQFKTNIRFGNESDRGSVNFVKSYTNNTISAMEEIYTLNITPVYDYTIDTLALQFSDATSSFDLTCEVTLTGTKFPIT